jgi:general L-amino acid transport system permease protein
VSLSSLALPLPRRRAVAAWHGLFGSITNTTVTLLTAATLWLVLAPFFRWAVVDATWTGTAADCRAADGACWAFLTEKVRFIVFAFYPPALQWRPTVAMTLLTGVLVVTALPRFWGPRLLAAWPVAIAASWLLMSGTLTPPQVSTNQWGGLPITLLVWTVCLAAAMPIAIGLALVRRSQLGGIRTLAVVYIELMRGTPMVAILYVAMLILPVAVPHGDLIDKNVRAILLVTLFWAAYLAEVVRGGLQAIPRGQEEAAAALGLGYWQTMRLVVLPQAFRIVLPGLVNQAIGFLLATSLLAVIGIQDLLNAGRAAATDPNWLGFYDEAYLFVAAIYFLACYGGSRYSRWLERYLRAPNGAQSFTAGHRG